MQKHLPFGGSVFLDRRHKDFAIVENDRLNTGITNRVFKVMVAP